MNVTIYEVDIERAEKHPSGDLYNERTKYVTDNPNFVDNLISNHMDKNMKIQQMDVESWDKGLFMIVQCTAEYWNIDLKHNHAENGKMTVIHCHAQEARMI